MTLTLPPFLLFGYWGFTPFPWLMILSSTHKDNKALIAHESYHQAQQRRDGWLKVNPVDEWRVVHWLANNYNLGISTKDARELLGLP